MSTPTPPGTVTVTVPGAGRAVITHTPGTRHADIRLTVALPADKHAAGLRLAAHLRALIGPARTEHRPHGGTHDHHDLGR